MIKDITIGQYYPEKSILHMLDPRVKIIGTIGYMVSLFIFESWVEYALLAICLGLVIMISHIPAKYILKGLKPVVVILIFTIAMKVLFTHGDTVLVEKGIMCISVEGICEAAFLGIRLCLLVIGASMMTYTTTPNQLTDGLEYVLAPLKIFRVHVSEIAMMMSIALRFIPILVEETDKITKAQMSRGADFENGNFVKKIKNMIPLLVPLFISAFKRASDLALAMEARCYQGGIGRTKMKPLAMKKNDFVACIILMAVLVLMIGIHIIL